MTNDQLGQQLAAINARLGRLEKALQSSSVSGETREFWALEHLLKAHTKGGEAVYAGAVTTPTGEHYRWQRQASAATLFATDWEKLDRVLAALGHPVRLRLLQAILDGKRNKSDLESLNGIGTTGQLYHHLKILEQGGWIRTLERGIYGVPGERVVPLLAILMAAAG